MKRIPGNVELYVGVDERAGAVVVKVAIDTLYKFGGSVGTALFALSDVQSQLFRAALDEAEHILETGVGTL